MKTVAEESSVTAAERATPETDAVWTNKSRNILAHSHNLERQRDEAVAERDVERIVRRVLVSALSSANHDCCNLSHPQPDQHDYDAPCPVEARIVAALALAAQLFRGN